MNTQKIDKILLNKYFGMPIFILILCIMFFTTFVVGSYPVEWIDAFFGLLKNLFDSVLNDGIIKELINDGILPGVGLVLSFLPNVIILFFCISLMDATGYMARVALLMNNFMKLFGLSGNSVVFLLMGFGCNVPAILTANTIKNKREKILTILLIPFMSCLGRLPVYVLITGMLFSKLEGVLVLILLYLLGVLLAILFSILFRNNTSNNPYNITKNVPNDIILPEYKMPKYKTLLKKVGYEAGDYLKKIFTVLLIASVIIWVLEAFPKVDPDNQTSQIEYSYIGRIGKKIEPILSPLGFDWRMSVALITGIAAKEAAVSSMGVLFSSKSYEKDCDNKPFSEQLKNAKYTTGEKKGEKIFTIPVGLTFMVFFLIYFPCVSVFITIKKVVGKKQAALIGMFTILAAYFVAFIVKIICDIIFAI